MKFLDKHINNKKELINFWLGFDFDKILKHPKDGSEGLMIVLISVDESSKLVKNGSFDKLKEHNNNYIILYEVPNGNDSTSYKAFIDKIVRGFKVKLTQPQPWKAVGGIKRGGLV